MKSIKKYKWFAYISIALFLLFWISSIKRSNNYTVPDYPLVVMDNEIRVKENGEVLYRFVPVEGGYMTFSYSSNITDHYGDSISVPTSVFDAKREEINSFLIGEMPVTQELWHYVTYGKFSPNYATFGVSDFIIYFDKYKPSQWVEFIQKLEEMTGAEFAIPTSEQWEYAARGGQKSHDYIYAGSNNIDQVAQYRDNTANKDFVIGKKKAPNELGLYDMSGSVFELTSTPYTEVHPEIKHAEDSIKDEFDGFVARGGDINHVEDFCRVKTRAFCHKNSHIGLRLILKY